VDADDLVDAINDSDNNSGPVYVHVVDRDHEYWLEVTGIKDTNLIEVPWDNGILIETKPVAEGVRARKDIFTPRPYFVQQPPIGQLLNGPDPDAQEWVDSLSDAEIPAGTLQRIPQERPKVNTVLPPMAGIEPGDTTHAVVITGSQIEIKYDLPHHSTGKSYFRSKIADIATKSPEQLKEMAATGELQAVYGIDPGEITGIVHTPLHGRMYEDVNDDRPDQIQGAGTEYLVEDRSEPHYWTYENAPEYRNPHTTEE
jgi:hypothetical protein